MDQTYTLRLYNVEKILLETVVMTVLISYYPLYGFMEFFMLMLLAYT